MEDRKPYRESNIYYPYGLNICPVCGGAIKHPYTGDVSMDQIEEDLNTCQWIECIDENNYTLGYQPICSRIHPYTLSSENHAYVHYDLIELVNTFKGSLEERVQKLDSYIKYLNPDIQEDQYSIVTKDDKITEVILNNALEIAHITLNYDGENVTVQRG